MSVGGVTIKCAACGKVMAVSGDLSGRPVRCPHCQTIQAPPSNVIGEELNRQPTSPLTVDDRPIPVIQAIETESILHDGEEPYDDLFSDGTPAIIPVMPEPSVAASEPMPASPWDHLTDPASSVGRQAKRTEGPTGLPPALPSSTEADPWLEPTLIDVPAPAVESAASGNGSPWQDEQTLEMAAPSAAERSVSAARPAVRPRAKLPLSFWLLALLLPCVVLLVPAIGLFAYFKILERGQERAVHPLEALGDDGIYKDLQEGKSQKVIDPLEELPKDVVPLRLGKTARFGGLEVTPVEIVRQTLPYHFYRGAAGYVSSEEALVLKLRLKNVSDIIFHPHDPTFNRAYKQGVKPYTYLMIGDKRFYGSVTDPLSERLQQQNFDELLPGQEMTTIFVAAQDPAANRVIDELRQAPPRQPLTWRVQLRKGREPIRGRLVWVTTVIPIEFTPAEVREGKSDARSAVPVKDKD